MKIINIRQIYPFYTSDCFCEVSDEIAEQLRQYDQQDHADVSTKRTILSTLTTASKMKSSCWFYRPRKSMSENYPIRNCTPLLTVCQKNRRIVSMHTSFLA